MSAAFSKRAGLLARAKAMLLRPGETWDEVEAAPATVRGLLLGYVAPLAAIGPVCGAVGLLVFGPSIAGIHLKVSPVETLAGAALDYGLSLLATYLLALIVSALAPAFEGRVDRVQAVKLVAYSGTAMWIAGVFALYPTLGFPLEILGGIYSLYVLHLGLPRLMDAAPERALTYFAAVLACALALGLALRLVSALLF